MKNLSNEVVVNRQKWMSALRSGKYIKGPVPKMDERGRVIEVVDGHCACAVLMHEMGRTFAQAKKAVGLSAKQCAYIQSELSDKLPTFEEVADRIEKEVFAAAFL